MHTCDKRAGHETSFSLVASLPNLFTMHVSKKIGEAGDEAN